MRRHYILNSIFNLICHQNIINFPLIHKCLWFCLPGCLPFSLLTVLLLLCPPAFLFTTESMTSKLSGSSQFLHPCRFSHSSTSTEIEHAYGQNHKNLTEKSICPNSLYLLAFLESNYLLLITLVPRGFGLWRVLQSFREKVLLSASSAH